MEQEINQTEGLGDVFYKAPPGPKKRILFVITQSELGGAQQFLARLLERLDKNRFDCLVVAGADGRDALAPLLPPHVIYQVARHLKRDPNFMDDILSVAELRSIFRQYRPDTIFLNSSKAGFNGSLATRLIPAASRGTVIYRIGGWAFNDPRPGWQRLLFFVLEKVSAGWKDYIVVNNQRDYDLALRRRIQPRRKVVLIHNGIDPYMEFVPPDQARAYFSEMMTRLPLSDSDEQIVPPQDPFFIGVIANFYPTKGLETLIDALAEVKTPFKTIICGEGTLRSKLQQRIVDRGLEKNVVLVGKVNNAWHYLKAFDLMVIPSLKEGFPWVALEAMAAKVPVLATQVGALPELIDSGRNGVLVPPRDSHALALAINNLIADERSRSQMVLQAHQDIIKQFDIRAMVERYEMLLNN